MNFMKSLLLILFASSCFAQSAYVPGVVGCPAGQLLIGTPTQGTGALASFTLVRFSCIAPPQPAPNPSPFNYCVPSWGIFNEVPQGVVDGVNKVFVTTAGPINGSQIISVNGLIQTPGKDYTVNPSNVIAFTVAPPIGAAILIYYRA